MKKQVLILVTLLLPLVASAYDLADDKGLFYNLKGDGTLEVVGLDAETTTADILSDVTIGGVEYRVTSIGERAFEGRSDLTYLSIPWSVTSIGEYAFIDCGSNITVNIADPESWCAMELGNEHSSPLSSARKVLVHDIETTSIIIPEGVTSIGNFTFYQCRCITSLIIPSSVKSIGSSAFEDCTGLTSLTISEGLETIGGSAFEGCTGLKILRIPSTVNTISINAFANCTGITDVYCYAENVPVTDENAFDGTPTENSILHVPSNTVEAYKISWPWSDFKEIVALNGEAPSVKRTIHVAKAGTLKDFISDDEKYQIEELTLTGELNGTDIRFIRDMAGIMNVWDYSGTIDEVSDSSTPGVLKVLDISSVQIVSGGSYYYANGGSDSRQPSYWHTIENSISTYMFSNCKLISIKIPNSTTSIGDRAFYGCRDLISINIPSNVASIGRFAFIGTEWYENQNNGLLYLDKWLIGYKVEIPAKELQIADGTKGIADNAFEYCKDLSSVTLPNSVFSIGSDAFYGCSGLTSVTIPNSVTSIGSSAFYGCGLISVTIPNSVTSIGSSAFAGCSSLTSVNIPNSVLSIGSLALYDTGWYNNQNNGLLYLDKWLLGFKGYKPVGELIISEGTIGIAESALANSSGLTSVTLPKSMKYIGNDAFFVCENLSSVTIGNSVISIGDYAFSNCRNLTTIISEIEMPFAIGPVFSCINKDIYATAILYVPENTLTAYQTTEGWNKFKNIIEVGDGGEISQIIVVDGIYYIIGENNTVSVTHGDTSYSGDIFIPNQVTYNGICYTVSSIDAFAFFKCSGLTSITIPSSVNQIIGDDAFDGCNNLSSVHISDIESWCSINFGGGSNPLQYAKHLFLNGIEIKELIIPEGVNNIGVRAFVGFNGFTSVTIPNSVTSISGWAFSGCSGVTSFTIGDGIERIERRAFANCPELTHFYCYAKEVPNTSDDAFDGTPTEKSTLQVPANAVDAYRAAWPWSDFKEIVPLSNDPFTDKGIIFTVKDDGTLEVTGLEDGTTTVDILSTVTIDGKEYQVTSIGKRAFEGRDNIEYLSIPWSVTSIGEFAFIDCGNNMTVNIADPESWCQMEIANEHSCPLSHAKKVLVFDIETDQIDIPESVTSIGKYTFYQCQCIKTLNIPATVTSIGSSAFEGCTGLASLTLSDGLESIGGSAFEGCTGLKNLVIPSTVNTISINAFKNCKEITDVYCYAEKVPNTDENAFDGTPTEKSILHVPASAVESYKATWPWSDFKEIVAINGNDPDGISKVKQDNCESSYYDLYGRRIHQPQQKGLYIRNGKKIVVK